MSYRDDLEAVRARADALERELAELRDRQAGTDHDARALADERRLQLLERAKLREQLEQTRRDAEQAQYEAEQAKRDAEQAKRDAAQAQHEAEQAKRDAIAARATSPSRALARPGGSALTVAQRRQLAQTGILSAAVGLAGAASGHPGFLIALFVTFVTGVALAIGKE